MATPLKNKPNARAAPAESKKSKARRQRARDSIKLLSERVDDMFLDQNGAAPSNYSGKDLALIEGRLQGLAFELPSVLSYAGRKNYDCDFCSVRVNSSGPNCMASFGAGVAIFVDVEKRVLSVCKTHKSRVAELNHLPHYREHPAFERGADKVHHDGLSESWWTVTSIGDAGTDQSRVEPLKEHHVSHELKPVTYHQSPATNRRFRILQGDRHDTACLVLANHQTLAERINDEPVPHPFDYLFFAQIDNQPPVRLIPGWPNAYREDIVQAPACRVPVPQWADTDDCLLLVLPDRFAFVQCRTGSTATETDLREARGGAVPPQSKSGRRQCCLAGSKLFVVSARRHISVYTVSVLAESDGLEIGLDAEWTRHMAELPPAEYIMPLGPDRFLIMTSQQVLALVVSE